jgi:hypothetical protein
MRLKTSLGRINKYIAGPDLSALTCFATRGDLAHAGQSQAAMLSIVLRRETPAIAMAFEAETRKPVQRLEARKPRCLSSLHAAKETIEGFLQAT